jgi:phospholipase/lecithinase/hemolysin
MKSMPWMRRGAAIFLGSMLALLIPAASALAAPYSQVVVYGDSLSDNGNFFASVGLPGLPYYQGRRSNGPVAVEQLASSLGAPLVDFAWIGATTGVGNYADSGTATSLGAAGLPGMTMIFNATKASLSPFVAGGLFIVWGGPNDFLAPSPLDVTPLDTVARAVGNELSIILELQGLGVQHILAPGMPDLGLTPYFRSLGPAFATQGSLLTDAFNAALMAALPADVAYYNTADLFRSVFSNPGGYGLTDVTTPCFDQTAQSICANPDQYLFFDDFHPTAAAHAILAHEFEAAVTVPEPGTIALLSIALMGLRFSRRKRLG